MMRMSGSIQKSTEVMKAMQGLIRIPEIQGAMMDLSREMSKVSSRGWDTHGQYRVLPHGVVDGNTGLWSVAELLDG